MRLLRESAPDLATSDLATSDLATAELAPAQPATRTRALKAVPPVEVAGPGAPVPAASFVDGIATVGSPLVTGLDSQVHSSLCTPAGATQDRWRSSDGRADDELVMAVRAGEDAALCELLTKYRSFARVKARSYFLVGADREDIVQEGMIGLYKAIRDFNPDMQSSFRVFAELCVTRQIITAIKTATRQKHGPLNNYVSFNRPVGSDDDGERVLGDVIATVAISDPADLVISAERVRDLQTYFDQVLSDLETEVLRLYVAGKSYQEIAERLQRHVKSIDNALQRIKRKLEGHLNARSVADAS